MAESITLVCQYFYPETAATAQLLTELAVELQKSGIQVWVYSAQPSYHRRDKLPKSEVYQGVHIRRMCSTQFDKNRLWGRLLNGFTFSLAVLFRLLFSRKHKVILATSNPPFLLWVAWLIAVVKRTPYVLLIHDIYPHVAVKLGYMKDGGIIMRLWEWLNRKAYRRASAIIVLGERMRTIVQEACSALLPIYVIHSWADGTLIRPRRKEDNPFALKHNLQGKIVVLYSGNLGQAHKLETLIEAADRLRDLEDLTFLFVGEGAKKPLLMSLAREKGLENVRFLPPVPYEELACSLPAGDIGVVTLEKGVEGLCEPSKLYAYLAAGLAILALVGKDSEVAKIVERHKCGCVLEQDDVEGVVEVLKQWARSPEKLEEMKHNARKCFAENYDKKIAISKYLKIVKTLGKPG